MSSPGSVRRRDRGRDDVAPAVGNLHHHKLAEHRESHEGGLVGRQTANGHGHPSRAKRVVELTEQRVQSRDAASRIAAAGRLRSRTGSEQHGRCQDPEDRDRDEQLDEREAPTRRRM